MGQIVKVVQEIGNGGHIYLPKETVGKKVAISLIEKNIEDVKDEIICILRPYLKHICGVYLHGSYARGEQTPESDIDVLVVTDGKIKIEKRINEYEIISSSLEQIEGTIKNNAPLILPILNEAEPILNQQLIEKYKKEVLTKRNTKWYIETTESSLKLAKHLIDEKDSMPNIVYPLVLRLRGLRLIELLMHGGRYSNKDILNSLIKGGVSVDKAKQIYKMYREYRDKKTISENSLNYEDITKLYALVYKYYQEVKLLRVKLR